MFKRAVFYVMQYHTALQQSINCIYCKTDKIIYNNDKIVYKRNCA